MYCVVAGPSWRMRSPSSAESEISSGPLCSAETRYPSSAPMSPSQPYVPRLPPWLRYVASRRPSASCPMNGRSPENGASCGSVQLSPLSKENETCDG